MPQHEETYLPTCTPEEDSDQPVHQCSLISLYKNIYGYQVIVFLFLHENICCGTHQKRLAKALLMSTHNICFHGGTGQISILLDSKKHLIKSYGF